MNAMIIIGQTSLKMYVGVPHISLPSVQALDNVLVIKRSPVKSNHAEFGYHCHSILDSCPGGRDQDRKVSHSGFRYDIFEDKKIWAKS